MKQISIDLETLGTNPDCVILSIGACLFDFEKGVGETFYVKLDRNLQKNRVTNHGTWAWWKRQDSKVFAEAMSGEISLLTGLRQFRNWLPAGAVPWGNGATFDVSILEHACAYEAPWKFWNVRDMRTLVDLTEKISDFNKKSIARQGDHHNALDDAVYQAEVMIAAYRSLKGD